MFQTLSLDAKYRSHGPVLMSLEVTSRSQLINKGAVWCKYKELGWRSQADGYLNPDSFTFLAL